MGEIKDGDTGSIARVDTNHRLHTQSVVETEAQHAAEVGDAYFIGSGVVGLTSSTDSAVFYFKTNEDEDIIIESLIVNVGDDGTTTEFTEVVLIKNPTGGDIITTATPVEILENKNFGSPKTIESSLAFVGVEGSTITGGDVYQRAFILPGQEQVLSSRLVLTKGASFAVTVNTKTTVGAVAL